MWLPLARKLDWNLPIRPTGSLPRGDQRTSLTSARKLARLGRRFKTSYREYVENQHEKDMAVYAVRDAVGRLETSAHGTVPPTLCDLYKLPLSAGTPRDNTANLLAFEGRDHIFCSQPWRWIFSREPERYASHKNLVKRVDRGSTRRLRGSSGLLFLIDAGYMGKTMYAGD
jgi:hypothetical protein